MTPEQQNEVWSMLDRSLLTEIAQRGPTPVFASISGAHLYGFASPDSDVDLRGAYLLSAREVLGLREPKETLSIEDKSVMDLDWVAHDIRKFCRLLMNHNGYVLEQLYSPLVVISSAEHEELMAIGAGCVTRPTVRHYLGFANGRRKRLAEPSPTVKHMLYAYRVLLTGIHMMRTGEVVANIQLLNEQFRIADVDELVARKRHGAEKMAIMEHELEHHARILDRLEQDLNEAFERSQLPLEPTSVDELNDFVIRIRLATLANPERA
jgi:uncharacterized protein